MATPSYTFSEFQSAVEAKVRNTASFTDANFLTLANEAIRQVLADADIRSTIRKASLSPNLFDEIYRYSCPSDLKGDKIIDIQPQIKRSQYLRWTLVTQEEFDRKKQDLKLDRYGDPIELRGTEWLGENLVAIERDDLANTLLLSMPIDDDEIVIDSMDAVGNWAAYGDGTNVTKDADNYVKGSASLNWDINADGGTTAGIYNASLDTFDISDYKSTGSAFVWAYLSDADDVTNFIVRIGSSASAYYSVTVTTNNEGNSFEDGWNLLRFDLSGKSTTGSPDDDGCDYVALYMTKDAGKTSETDYRFDNLVLKRGDHYYVKYYSKYGWQNSSGTYLEDSTDSTDLLNADTDEVNLYVLKACQLIEEHLDNDKKADRWEQKYGMALARYIQNNGSEALPQVQEYYHI